MVLSFVLGTGFLMRAAASPDIKICFDMAPSSGSVENGNTSCNICAWQPGTMRKICGTGFDASRGVNGNCLSGQGWKYSKDTFISTDCDDAMWIDRFYIPRCNIYGCVTYYWGSPDNSGWCLSEEEYDHDIELGRGVIDDKCYKTVKLTRTPRHKVFGWVASKWCVPKSGSGRSERDLELAAGWACDSGVDSGMDCDDLPSECTDDRATWAFSKYYHVKRTEGPWVEKFREMGDRVCNFHGDAEILTTDQLASSGVRTECIYGYQADPATRRLDGDSVDLIRRLSLVENEEERRRSGRICCMAMIPSCLACQAGVTEEEYCEKNPGLFGCPAPKVCCDALTAHCEACKAGVSKREFCAKNPTYHGCQRPDTSTPAPERPANCACTREYKPVCDLEGKTHPNPCMAFCAGADIDYDGKCMKDKPDQEPCLCTMEFAPVCGTDGKTYSNDCVAGCRGAEIASEGPCTDDRV